MTDIAITALARQFEQAVKESRDLSERPSNDTLLKLYALYKQATEGDVQTGPPANLFDFVARAKYDSWLQLKGKTKEEGMQEYINLVGKLKS